MAGDLRLSYSQFEELETFARFGTQLDEETNRTLERGRRVRQVLKQPQYATMRVAAQIAVLVAVNEGVFDPVPLDEIAGAEKRSSKPFWMSRKPCVAVSRRVRTWGMRIWKNWPQRREKPWNSGEVSRRDAQKRPQDRRTSKKEGFSNGDVGKTEPAKREHPGPSVRR